MIFARYDIGSKAISVSIDIGLPRRKRMKGNEEKTKNHRTIIEQLSKN